MIEAPTYQLVAVAFWIACTYNCCTCCHLHGCEVFKMRERSHGQLKSEIMNGDQSDGDHDADDVQRRTLRSSDVTFLKQTGWYGLSGFEFPIADQLCIQNVTHVCLFVKCTTHLKLLNKNDPGTARGIHLWNYCSCAFINVVHIECVLLYSSENKINTNNY